LLGKPSSSGVDADFFAARQDFGDDSELPLFIVGMSRSGTILVEQIAASDPAVFSTGEREDLGVIAGQHSPLLEAIWVSSPPILCHTLRHENP
jgi:hypothetical protein